MIGRVNGYLKPVFMYGSKQRDYKRNFIVKDDLSTLNANDTLNFYVYVDQVVYRIRSGFDQQSFFHPTVMPNIKNRIKRGDFDFTNDFNFHSTDQKKMWEKYRFGILKDTASHCVFS